VYKYKKNVSTTTDYNYNVPLIAVNKPTVTYKIFSKESPGEAAILTIESNTLKFRISNDESHVRMVEYDPDLNIVDDRRWELESVNTSDPRWTVCRVHNDDKTFDIIFFNQSDGEQLIIFDYNNGAHTEITGDLDY